MKLESKLGKLWRKKISQKIISKAGCQIVVASQNYLWQVVIEVLNISTIIIKLSQKIFKINSIQIMMYTAYQLKENL